MILEKENHVSKAQEEFDQRKEYATEELGNTLGNNSLSVVKRMYLGMLWGVVFLFAVGFGLSGCSENPADAPDSSSSLANDVSSGMESSSAESVSSSSGNLSSSVDISSSTVEEFRGDAVIDNLEDGDGENELDGGWYVFTDKVSDGLSTTTPAQVTSMIGAEGAFQSDNGLFFSYTISKGDYAHNPYVAVGTSLATGVYDASEYAGFQYWHKGAAHRVRLEIPAVEDYDYHILQVAEHEEWTLVTVDFAEVLQEGWGDPVGFDPAQIHTIVWEFRGPDGSTDSAWIDEVYFVNEITYELKNDMVIRDPEIPEELATGDYSVNTPLNDLTMQYLNKGVNLTNWLEENRKFTEFEYDESDVIRFASQGFLGIRLPIDLDLYVVERDSVVAGDKEFSVDSTIWTPLDSLEAWTARHNLSLTIDYHQYDGSFNGESAADPGYRTMAATIWKAVAERYSTNTREDIFYELTNEPDLETEEGQSIAQEDWRVMAQEMIDSIRTVDTEHAIIFGDVEWYSLDRLVENEPFADDKIIYAFHYYDPFIFTHQAASWAGLGSTKNTPFPYTKEEWSTEFRYFGVTESTPSWVKSRFRSYYRDGNKIAMKNRLFKVKEWAHEHQVPLVCNEFGANPARAKPEHLANYFQAIGEIFQELDIAWQVWFGTHDSEGNLLPGLSESLQLDP